MLSIFQDSKFPFMALSVPAAVLSIILCGLSVFFIFSKGLNFGVDFAGGVQMVLNFDSELDVDAERLRGLLADQGIEASVQSFGSEIADVGDEVLGEENAAAQDEYIVHFSADFADETLISGRLASVFEDLSTSPENPGLQSFRFSGIEKAYFEINREMELEEVEQRVRQANFGLLKVKSVKTFGNSNSFELQFSNISQEIVSSMESNLNATPEQIEIAKLDFVGAKVGSDLKQSALLSVLVTIFLVFVYIFLRFDLVYAPGVVVALGHDVLITVGVFALFGVEFDLTVVAALLTVAGYSINDTIVVFDRIRECQANYRGKSFRDIMDLAINQTLSRTVITSGTTLAATGILWFFGGPVIHSFAFALCIGVVVGTYSTVFVASSLILWVQNMSDKGQNGGSAKKKAAAA